MRKILLFTAAILLINIVLAQEEKSYETICVAFYNVENLFDTINQPDVEDIEFLPESEKKWGTKRFDAKIKKLSTTIAEIGKDFTGEPPAIIGLCEVENRSVIEDLANTEALAKYDYGIEHYDCWYYRGVDVGLMYRRDYFEVTHSVSYKLQFSELPDLSTRDQLLVSGLLLGEPVHFIVLHYPSRRGGEKRSRPLRIEAAELTKHIVDSLQNIDKNAKIIIMGDLNDDPINESVKKVLNSHGDKDNLKEDELYNPMANLFKKGIGSLAYRDSWNLFDQIIITPSLIKDDYSNWTFYKAFIYNKPFLMQKEGRFKGYPFRTFVGNTYQGGYSDHFPAYMYLIRELKN
jgi:endonuclease/exonuclease/phosphatase family metal-dependent hydrolase